MVAPTVLPGRSFQRIDRVSRLLFHWRARDCSLTPVTSETPAFARASAGGAVVDRNGFLSIPVHSQPRFDLLDLDADGVRESPALLLEDTQTFLAMFSEILQSWTKTGTPTEVNGQKYCGVVKMDLITDDAAGSVEYYARVTPFTGNTEKAVAVLVARGTSPAASGSLLAIRDTTAAVNRLAATLTFNAAGVPSVSMAAGTHLRTVAMGDGIYALFFRTTAVTATNSNEMQIHPAAVSAETGNLIIGGIQVENSVFSTSYTKTDGSTVVRAVETLSYPFAVPPGAKTIYVRFVERGSVQLTTSPRMLQIGAVGDTDPRLVLTVAGGVYRLEHDNGSATVTSAALAAPAFGDVVELRGVLGADGSVRLHQALNAGGEASGALSAANALGSAYSAELLSLNGRGSSNVGFAAYLEVKIGAGDVALTDLREMV